MNRTPSFEDHLGDWLEDGPTDAPDRVLETVLAAFPSIPQRGVASRLPWRFPTVAGFARGVAIATAVAAIVALTVVNSRSANVVGGPTAGAPSPTISSASASPPASPSPSPMDTSNWVAFTSSLYGITVRHPADWTTSRASVAWVGVTPDAPDAAFDTFASPDGPVFFVASQRLSSGTTEMAWLTSYEAKGAALTPSEAQCWPAPAKMDHATVDGMPAWVDSGCANEAIVFTGGRVYVIFAMVDPLYNWSLFTAFLSTVKFDPAAGN